MHSFQFFANETNILNKISLDVFNIGTIYTSQLLNKVTYFSTFFAGRQILNSMLIKLNKNLNETHFNMYSNNVNSKTIFLSIMMTLNRLLLTAKSY